MDVKKNVLEFRLADESNLKRIGTPNLSLYHSTTISESIINVNPRWT